MERWLIFAGLTGALLQVNFARTYHYYFVNTSLNWTDAQTACRRDYTDLASIENIADVEAVNNTNLNYKGKAWIGLNDELVDSWKWSLNDSSFYGKTESTFKNWDDGEPTNTAGRENCVALHYSTGKWHDYDCKTLFPFVCYNGTICGRPCLVMVNILKTWTEAQTYCRETYIDLASISNWKVNDHIRQLGELFRSNVWIGLYREKLWSDGSTSLFQNWANGQPNGFSTNSTGATCTAAGFGNQEGWFDEECTLSLPFICYRQFPQNPEGFKLLRQDETSITLQWNKVNGTYFVLKFNGIETNISVPDGDGPVVHTVSSLTAGTKYTFTLFSVFDNIRSSGISINATSAPFIIPSTLTSFSVPTEERILTE
ncbi:macrophage mannose receptor 1-like [Anableps anableps]